MKNYTIVYDGEHSDSTFNTQAKSMTEAIDKLFSFDKDTSLIRGIWENGCKYQ